MRKKTEIGLDYKPRRLFWTIGVIIVFFVEAVFLCGVAYSKGAGDNVYPLQDGWTVTYKGKQYQNVNIDTFPLSTSDCKKGDSIILERELNATDAERWTIRLYTRLSQVNVLVDQKSCYMSGYQEVLEKRITGSGYHFVLIPAGSNGKHLKIIVNAAQDQALEGLPKLVFTSADYAMEYFVRGRALGLFVGIFIVMAGAAIALLSIPAMVADRDFYPLSMIGLFSVFAGMWCLTSIKALEIFSLDLSRNSVIEYVSLYMLPIPLNALAGYFYSGARRLSRKLFLYTARVDVVAVFIISVLSRMRKCNVSTGLLFFHILIVWEVILLLTVTVVRWKKSSIPERLFGGSIIAACVTGATYILFYNLSGQEISNVTFVDTTMMPLAFLIMVVLVTIAFLVNVYSRRMSDVQHARLLRLAYKDDMTGLYNRTKGEEILAMLKQEKAPYALVNMDLNFLKKVNDAYGHEAGDAYIKKFAQLLRSTFVNMPICRMGGDEFLVIVTGVDAVWATVRDRLAALNEAIAACNREKDGRFLVDVSVGVARSDETRDGEPESVYRLADKRMYDMKRESKKGRKEE